MPISPKKRKHDHPRGLFRKIFVSANRELAPFGMVFVYPPENFERQQLGTVFGLIKISDTSPESSFVANLLASVIKKEYFSRPDRPAYDSFEASLKKANLALAELARQGSVKWIGKISFAGGALEKNHLHFSKLGTASILLLRGGMIADIGTGLDEDIAEIDSHPIKTFSDISSGKVELDDRLVFTTSDLLEIFSFEEIRQNAARFPPEEFPDILAASLTANSELSGAIVVSLVLEEEVPTENNPIEKKSSHSPAAPLENVPSISSPRPAYVQNTSPDRKEKNIFVSESEDIIPKKIFAEKAFLAAKTAFSASKNGIFFIRKKIYRLFRRIDWKKIFSSIKEIRSPKWRSNLQNMPKANKRTLAITGAAIVLIILFFSISKIIGNKKTLDPQPSALHEQTADPATVINDINTKNIENISNVAALPADSDDLLFMNDSLFSLTGEKSILEIDPASGATEKSDSAVESGKFTLAAAMPDLNTIFILTADKKVFSFTPSNKKFQENGISLPGNLNASDMKAYLTYIYILDSAANQIYRYPRAEGGFGERQDWLKSGQDLNGTDKFAINEAIFATNDLNIIPLLKGKFDDSIDFQKPQTPLRIDAIYTDTDFANVYVLDNMNHRIVQYGKDGKIAAQYWNDRISGIKNIVADEKNKVIYLQKTDSVLKFSME
jgi:hypothetical protein